MSVTVKPEQIALVNQLLPASAKEPEVDGGYGWTDQYITDLIIARSFTPTQAVRFFWLQRVNETAEYLDVGKPLTQIHRQAREMLDYWDNVLGKSIDAIGPTGPDVRRPMSFGEIERFC